jgi:hypothetical protein
MTGYQPTELAISQRNSYFRIYYSACSFIFTCFLCCVCSLYYPNNQGSILITLPQHLIIGESFTPSHSAPLFRLMSTREEDKRNGTWSFDNHQEMMEHVLIILAADQLDPNTLYPSRLTLEPKPSMNRRSRSQPQPKLFHNATVVSAKLPSLPPKTSIIIV